MNERQIEKHEKHFSRRAFLKLGGAGAIGLAGATWLAAQQTNAPAQTIAPHQQQHALLPLVQAPGVEPAGKLWHPQGLDPMDILTDFDAGKLVTASNQTVHEYEFVAFDKQIEVAPGVLYPAWTYNGRVPGPIIGLKAFSTSEFRCGPDGLSQ